MRKKPKRKRPYFKMESAMTAILRDASGEMHHGILFDRRLVMTLVWLSFSQVNPFVEETGLSLEKKYRHANQTVFR